MDPICQITVESTFDVGLPREATPAERNTFYAKVAGLEGDLTAELQTQLAAVLAHPPRPVRVDRPYIENRPEAPWILNMQSRNAAETLAAFGVTHSLRPQVDVRLPVLDGPELRASQKQALQIHLDRAKNDLRQRMEAETLLIWPSAAFARDMDALVAASRQAQRLSRCLTPTGEVSPWEAVR